LENLVFQV